MLTIRSKVCLIGLSLLASGCSALSGVKTTDAALVTDHKALAFQASEQIAKDVTGSDRHSLSAAEEQALNYGVTGQAIDWKRGDGRQGGTVIAYQPFRVGNANCRRFRHQLAGSDNAPTVAEGTACRNASGDWRLVN